MAQHSANGLGLASYLSSHPRVTKVIYPGLPGHPQHELARRQMPNGCGRMLSFEVASPDEARRVLKEKMAAVGHPYGG